jgi:protein-tyrosine phosphatase
VPYEDLFDFIFLEKSIPVTFDRLSIKGMSVPTERFIHSILNQIDLIIMKGRPIYLHCLGGIGRTGTVVGFYLMRHRLATLKKMLEIIRK